MFRPIYSVLIRRRPRPAGPTPAYPTPGSSSYNRKNRYPRKPLDWISTFTQTRTEVESDSSHQLQLTDMRHGVVEDRGDSDIERARSQDRNFMSTVIAEGTGGVDGHQDGIVIKEVALNVSEVK